MNKINKCVVKIVTKQTKLLGHAGFKREQNKIYQQESPWAPS